MTDDVIEKAHLISLSRARTRRKIEDALDTIAAHWDGAMSPPKPANSERRTPPRSKPPMPIDPASAIDAAWRDLRSWGQLVMEERDLSQGPRTGHTPACRTACTDKHPATGPQIARWLALHADWMAAHEAGPDAAAELARHGRRLRDIDLGYRSRRFIVGQCPEEIHDETSPITEPCIGNLWALIREEDTMLPDRVVCDANEWHTWSPSQWAALGRRLGNLHPDGVERLLNRLSGYSTG